MQHSHKVTLIPGDGIGPEIMNATRSVLGALEGVSFSFDEQVAGGAAFRGGVKSGVPTETQKSIEENRVALKGPLETPIGFGERSANVTLRGMFGLTANVRPARSIPGVVTRFDNVDLVIVRENSEDLYVGDEHHLSPSYAVAQKVVTHQASASILEYACELALAENRPSLHVVHKANILKLTEGMFANQIGQLRESYPTLKIEGIIIDALAEKLVRFPERFGVLVMTNMHGDVMSDLAAGLVGGLGVAASANLGPKAAMFEAVHGSAPDIAGKGVANPTALLLSAELMLRYFGEFAAAQKLRDAIFVTLAEGKVRTADLRTESSEIVGTDRFADEVIKNLGRSLSEQHRSRSSGGKLVIPSRIEVPLADPRQAQDVGVDCYIDFRGTAQHLLEQLNRAVYGTEFQVESISDRGNKLNIDKNPTQNLAGIFCCRLKSNNEAGMSQDGLEKLLTKLREHELSTRQVTKLLRDHGQNKFS